ncbi:MAG: GNAT family N-acetyltransferase, partial [Actinomycetota bacterium]|nr:GNAT family N-acetyltransferase [Actinomycetota bacterium]
MKLRAELLADGGEAASGADFFRSPGFLEAEGTTHSLVVNKDGDADARVFSAPLVVREIPGTDRKDAISPYAYPGVSLPDTPADGVSLPVDPSDIDFSGTGLVTLFLRHALGPVVPLLGPTGRNLCLLSDPSLPRKSRMSDRQQIRKNLKRGYTLEIVPGPESSTEQRAGFLTAYTETMRRTDAADRYFFDRDYFGLILAEESTWLV